MCEPEFINHFYYDEDEENEHIFTRVKRKHEKGNKMNLKSTLQRDKAVPEIKGIHYGSSAP